jgi:hypothetical protein
MSDPQQKPEASKSDYNFDFNADIPPIASRAAEAVAQADVLELFERLHEANRKFKDGPSDAAIAALHAVMAFLGSNPFNSSGEFSRPLDLLTTELRWALSRGRPPLPGNILPQFENKQTSKTARRKAVNYIKMAAAYAAHWLYENKTQLGTAYDKVYTTLKEHQFPVATDRDETDEATTIKRWREEGMRGSKRSHFFERLCESPPVPHTIFIPATGITIQTPNANILAWLKRELEHTDCVRVIRAAATERKRKKDRARDMHD